MPLRQEESLAPSSILAHSPLPPTQSGREAKRISAKKLYEKNKIKIGARDVERKRKKRNEKTDDERNIQRENARVTQKAYRAQRSTEKKEATRVANMERMRKGKQKSAGLLVIPAIGGHASGETVSAELPTGKTKEIFLIRREKATEARRVSRARQTPEQNEAVRDANKKRMKK